MSCATVQYATFASPEAPFRLLAGGELQQVHIAFETWGELTPARDNMVLITTGLSATTHVASHGQGTLPGWWEGMIGPGKALDTRRWFVVCTNVLGGCFGSTGPASANPATGLPYATRFPVINVEDMVEAQAKVLDHLGVNRIHAVMGASLGGMQALQWGVQQPQRVGRVIAMATPGRSYAFSIAWRAVQRWVVINDPAWKNGEYAPGEGPVAAMNTARAIGMLSYRSPQEFDKRFGRDLESGQIFTPEARFSVESYLAHNAAKFGRQFDANSYLLLARAMDYFDLGRGCPSFADGVARLTSPSLIIGFTSDLLFPVAQQRELHHLLAQAGRPVRYEEVETVHGHDAFLIEIDRLGPLVAEFLQR